MSLFSALSLFSRINQSVYCCTKQLFNKSQNNVKFSLYSTFPNLNRVIENNVVNNQMEKSVTHSNTEILKKVNDELKYAASRAFAVVQVCGKQFKVTTGDVIIIEGFWPPDVGDKINLNKVLCAGSVNFSMIGTPLVQSGLVNVNATVIEKALSHTKTHFRKKRRKQYIRLNFYRSQRTVLRINDVAIGVFNETVD